MKVFSVAALVNTPMEFRTIPELPDYEASQCGIIRRRERASKNAGKPPIPTKVIGRIGVRPNFVSIRGKWFAWADLTRSAWQGIPLPERGDGGRARVEPIEEVAFDAFNPWAHGRPQPSHNGSRIITLAELRAERWGG